MRHPRCGAMRLVTRGRGKDLKAVANGWKERGDGETEQVGLNRSGRLEEPVIAFGVAPMLARVPGPTARHLVVPHRDPEPEGGSLIRRGGADHPRSQ